MTALLALLVKLSKRLPSAIKKLAWLNFALDLVCKFKLCLDKF
ncbi:hypothetical protein CAMRE0001_1264 [Campylobacter rectus RM3267]|uniref:Uncharacterized protein n=1 Tax=Campylobacter rectus RM3267 TaxID=553218 RepID=B9D0Q4_CAMRE|nr:hypothetical protein CAMRE0001_1264 [Campylobacter rectus RM3267]